MDKLKERIQHYVDLFGLTNWKIKVTIQPNLNATARTLANPNYFTAETTFKEENPGDDIIIHEMIHVLFALYDYYADNLISPDAESYVFTARESAVSQLTNIMLRILQKPRLSDQDKQALIDSLNTMK